MKLGDVFKPALVLDATMSPTAALERLALHGFWRDPGDEGAAQVLARISKRTGRTVAQLTASRARPLDAMFAVIRRQRALHVNWHVHRLDDFIDACKAHKGAKDLLVLTELSEPANAVQADELVRLDRPCVLLRGYEIETAAIPPRRTDVVTGRSRGGLDLEIRSGTVASQPSAESVDSDAFAASAIPAARPSRRSLKFVEAWPYIDAYSRVRAERPFKVTVGFAQQKGDGVAGARMKIPRPSKDASIDMTIELSAAQGVRALDGWTRSLQFHPDDIDTAQVTFDIIGDVDDPDEAILTMLEVRYVMAGTVIGFAAKPIMILGRNMTPTGGHHSQPMLAEAQSMLFAPDADAPDLTIEISKPDRNAANGHYVVTLRSPHALNTARGPFYIDLGQDARTFASALVDEVREASGDVLLEMTLEAQGRLIAQCLPAQVFEALSEVARHSAPESPAVLIVSAEPYVPWELAWMDTPLDATQPAWLGCQTLLGRWLRAGNDEPLPNGLPRPATHPLSRISVRHLAVMAAWYKRKSGLTRLQKAEDEARSLARSHDACRLDATAGSMRDLLQRSLQSTFPSVEDVEAVHFAGHGDFEIDRADASVLFLSNGAPLRSTLFRAAKFGGTLQPLLFLNACMLGVGGELLGDMSGFPGNALRGGFGGVLGALWEVDDQIAHDIALEFWRRALPPPPACGEPIGAILRSLRRKYLASNGVPPDATYLAYVFYGHPRLRLTRAN